MSFGAVVRAKLRGLFAIDLRALAALRIALAGLSLVDLALRARDLTAFTTEEGVLPAALATRISLPGAWSLHFAAGPLQAAALFAVHALAAAALLVGWRTRIAAIATWFFFVSLHHRNVAIEQGGDDVLRVVLFWALWLPLGARFSLDARTSPSVPEDKSVSSIASAALMLQIAAVYWIGFLHKWDDIWLSGEAAWHALSHDQVGRPWAQHLLLPHPALVTLLGRVVLWVELFLPTMLFVPWRTRRFRIAAIAGIALLQIGLGVTLEVAHFPWVSALVLVVFVPLSSRLEPRALPDPRTQWLVGALAAYVALWLVVGLWRDGDAPLGRGSFPGTALGLDQRWTMFAPPATDSGWFVFQGELSDGTRLDVFPSLADGRSAQTLTWEKPADVFATFPNTRWLDYLTMLREEDDAVLWSGLGRWVCARWQRAHPEGPRLERFAVTYVIEETTSPGRPRQRERQDHLLSSCAALSTR